MTTGDKGLQLLLNHRKLSPWQRASSCLVCGESPSHSLSDRCLGENKAITAVICVYNGVQPRALLLCSQTTCWGSHPWVSCVLCSTRLFLSCSRDLFTCFTSHPPLTDMGTGYVGLRLTSCRYLSSDFASVTILPSTNPFFALEDFIVIKNRKQRHCLHCAWCFSLPLCLLSGHHEHFSCGWMKSLDNSLPGCMRARAVRFTGCVMFVLVGLTSGEESLTWRPCLRWDRHLPQVRREFSVFFLHLLCAPTSSSSSAPGHFVFITRCGCFSGGFVRGWLLLKPLKQWKVGRKRTFLHQK